MNYIVTGLICSGKSTFLNIAEEKNFKILKSDDLVSEYYKDNEILNQLEKKLNLFDFKDNPKLLIKKLFLESEKNKEIIESIFHPVIHRDIDKELSVNKNLMVEVPAIINNKNIVKNNTSIFIESSDINRLKRFKTKAKGELKYFEKMNEYQKDYSLIKSCCDIIVTNNNNVENLYNYFDERIIKS